MARAHVPQRTARTGNGAEKAREVAHTPHAPADEPGDTHADAPFEWGVGGEVCVGAFGEVFIARQGYNIRMRLEDCILCGTFLRVDELALFLDMTVIVERRLDVATMTADAQRVFHSDNAGGSSELSEAFSMELLARTLGARLDKTEMELCYFTGDGSSSKLTDFSIVLDGRLIGVSVTRACNGWPPVPGSWTVEDATRLLTKKLLGVIESTRHVSNASWSKQLLHVLVPDASLAAALHEASALVAPELIANTVVLVTLCGGGYSADLFKRDESAPALLKKRARIGLGWKSADHLGHLAASDPCRCARDAAAVDAGAAGMAPGA
ncbi:hypothetical protein KFE25_013670 [Diacronema lutheri]|uniref:Uncharacterized protein n=1 Tax=Diacronema lutheri TaxID=2081491 RepID=A0A7R9YH86_DIALT|nr:hypothetical protein KFE25_013670 [Diacronema lutheri]|mmetsp:Transcript_1340/g.4378  ORF Transcript_1340/g.4378 Transcript_1340/m.4378 type:complete len:324 (+) Transcript_1340:29-1000(+)